MQSLILLTIAISAAAPLPSATIKHPVFPATGSYDTAQKMVADLMATREAEMLALVPDRNGMLFCGCPNCKGGTQDSQMAWNGPSDPNRVHCQFCDMVFPNEQYPLNQSIDVINRAGEKETWRYHGNGKPEDQYYFEARARYFAKEYMAARLLDFARLYALSGDENHGRRAVLLLRRFAEVFPRWCVVHDYPAPGKKYPVSAAQAPYPYWAGIWNRWHLYDTPTPVALAYDLVYHLLDDETRHRVEIDLLRADVAYQRAYDGVTGESQPYDQVAPQRSTGFILIGRVINEPDFIHDGVQRIRALCAQDFHFDGMYRMGTPSYHTQIVNNCRIAADYAHGYSDPPGYTSPRDGRRFADLDLAKEITSLGQAALATLKMTLPNGLVVPVHDAWAAQKSSKLSPHALGAMLLNSYGHGRLSFGDADHATQAHLHFSGGDGHLHYDNLSLLLWAHDRELLSDVGYTHTPWRFWALQSPSHNTVVVDGKSHHTEVPGGNLRLFDATTANVQVIDVSQPRTYPDVTEAFRRRLIQVRVDNTRAYVVDIFTVRGGKQHDYFLHGSCDRPQSAETSLPLKPVSGTLLGPDAAYRLPAHESDPGEGPEGQLLAYAMFSELQEATTDQPFHIDWRFDDDASPRLRTHVTGQVGCRVISACTPQIRPVQNGPHGEDQTQLDRYWKPSVVVRREGTAPLSSTFVVVHEAYAAQPFITSVTGSLTIEHVAGTDTISSSDRGVSVVRTQDGRERFRYDLDEGVTGRVIGVQDGALSVDADLSAAAQFAGRTMVVTHGDGSTHGYLITSIERGPNHALVHVDGQLGFVIEGDTTRFTSFPRREVKGANTVRLHDVRYVEPE
jgi:hypothetical protein